MGKEDKLIMVVRRQDLFTNSEGFDDSFNGFKSLESINFEERILKNYGFMTRKFAEIDSDYKQPIAYSLVINPDLKKVFSYQRSKKDKNYSEKRLQGKFSLGIGGHIEKNDIHLENANPIYDSLLREIKEEINLEVTNHAPEVLGYIYHNFGINAVHFGILYVVRTNFENIKPKDPEIDNGKLRSIKELEQILCLPEFELEEWSKTSLNPLKDYFEKL